MEFKIKPGGLMRCCTQSLHDAMELSTTPPKEGDTLKCKYCKDEYGMVFKTGFWQWAAPPWPC